MAEQGELIDETTVRFERLLPGPIERVWSFLTESDKRSRWLCGGDVEQRQGGRVDMHFHNKSLSSDGDIPRPDKYQDRPEKVSFLGSVTRCEAPYRLQHTWDFDGEPSEVCYELSEHGDKVRLVLTHRRLPSLQALQDVGGGWHTHLNVLEDTLSGGRARPFYKMQQQYDAEYARMIAKARTR